jgi:hypothetical protein
MIGPRKPLLQASPALYRLKELVREEQQTRRYTRERERYWARLRAAGVRYDEASVIERVRARIRERGFRFPTEGGRPPHTFGMVARVSWQGQLLDELGALGEVSEFDFSRHAARLGDKDPALIAQVGREMREAFEAAQRRRPVDWIFSYAAPDPIDVDFLPWVYRTYGTPSVNLAMDDKHSWHERHDALYRAFDLGWTTARESALHYEAVGARGVYLPPGFKPPPPEAAPATFDIPVSFVGAAYGFRPKLIQLLREAGVDVAVYGADWGDLGRGRAADPADIFRRSLINLGFGGVVHSDAITTVKGRDFEVVGAGGGAYLTTFNADLTDSFVIGREILCYRNALDLPEVLRHYMDRPDECRAVAKAGYERSLREHRWVHRFRAVLEMLGYPAQGG